MQTKKIANLFESYLAAFKAYDLNEVTKCYYLPCTLHTPDKVVLLTDIKSFQQEFNNIFIQLQQATTSDIKASKASYSIITEQLLVASIDWEFVDESGEIFADFCAVYHLAMVDNEWKIINVVSHDLVNSLTLEQPFSLSHEFEKAYS